MGVGPTSLVLGVIENDEDLRELSEAQIRERLRFFRNWKMTDVSYALSRMDGLADAESAAESGPQRRQRRVLRRVRAIQRFGHAEAAAHDVLGVVLLAVLFLRRGRLLRARAVGASARGTHARRARHARRPRR